MEMNVFFDGDASCFFKIDSSPRGTTRMDLVEE
jgi:hypothetical protein